MSTETKNIRVLEKAAENITAWVGSIPSLIVHTVLFICAFMLPVFKVLEFDQMLLILTTILSLEAIYLSIFIQLSVNRSREHIEDLKDDVSEIQEDIEDIQEDIEEISEDIDDIQEDIEEINEDEDEDEEDHNERAKKVMLKSNVSSNKNEIKVLKDKIQELQNKIEDLKTEE